MSQYASTGEFATNSGLPSSILGEYGTPELQKYLVSASGVADDYFRDLGVLPISSPSDGLKVRVSHIAAYLLMSERGFNPESAKDQLIVKNYNDAIAWLERIADGKIAVPDLAPTTPEGEGAGDPGVSTTEPRGW